MLSTSPDGSADKIQVFDFKMNYKLLSPSTISLYTPTFLSTMLQIVIILLCRVLDLLVLVTCEKPTQPRVLCIYTFSFCQFFRKRLNPHKTKFLLYGEKMKFRICRDPLSFSFLCKRVGKLGAYERLPYKYLISPFANEI